MAREIAWRLQFDWDFDGIFTDHDESDYLIEATGDSRLVRPGDAAMAGRGLVSNMQITLDNSTSRFSSLNSSGALYSLLTDGGGYHVPVKLDVSIDGGSNYYEVFRGVTKMPQESGTSRTGGQLVRITCRSAEEAVLSKRVSTTGADMRAWHANGLNESELIAEILADAGLADGSDFKSQAYADANADTATLDPGLFTIPWAWLDDESPIEDCWALAAACGGRFYAKADGMFYYENAQNWLLQGTTPVKTLTRGSYKGPLQPKYEDSNLFETVVVEAQPRRLGENEVIWSPDEVIIVSPGETKTVTARLRQPAYSISGATYDAVTAGGENLAADVTVTLPSPKAQRVDVQIVNSNATKSVRLRNFQLIGRPLLGEPTIEEQSSSAKSYWVNREGRTRRMQGNPYVQTRSHAKFIAQLLRDTSEDALLTITAPGVPGDPSLQLGQRVRFNDSSVMSAAVDGYITSIRWQLGRRFGFKQDIEAIEADRLYPYAADDYFIVGTSTWGGSDRVYY